MKSRFNLPFLVFFCTIALILYSCKEDEELFPKSTGTNLPTTIAGALDGLDEFSSLKAILEQSRILDSLFNDANSHVLLAPINSAFEGVDLSSLSNDEIRNLLLNHVYASSTADFVSKLNTGYYTTLATGPGDNPISLYLEKLEDESITINGISAIDESNQDLGTTNGVIHGVDALLTLPTVADHIAANPNYSSLASALKIAGITNSLSGSGTFTVFAPNNFAFEKFLMDVNTLFGWSSLNDIPVETLQEVLTYHVVPDVNVLSSEVDGSTQTSVQGSTFSIAGTVIDDPSTTDANITEVDIQSANGIIHGIDKVIITENVYQQVLGASLDLIERLENKGFTNLLAAIEQTGLTDSLRSVTEVTVFAPNNSAFDALFIETQNFESLDGFDTPEEIIELKNLLRYHLFAGSLMESQLIDGEAVSTGFGADFTIDLSQDQPRLVPTFDDAIPSRIVESNIGSTNGIIHEIDRVLIATEFLTPLGIVTEDPIGLHPVGDPELVFFDWDAKGPWWGNATAENEASLSLDGSSYGRVNLATGGTGWVDLFWRNGGSMNGADVVGSNLSDYSLKFDINVIEPISEGQFTMRFNNTNSGVDAFYTWAPWNDTGEPFMTDGWTTVEIPLALLGQTDFTGLDQEFGMAFQDGDVTLNFAIDNVRFDTPGGPSRVDEVDDPNLVFYDWDGKDHWWGNAVNENDPAVSLDGSNYARLNFQTGGTGWVDLFWRNSGSMNGSDVVGSNIGAYAMKFEINVMEPIADGSFTIRFNNTNSGVDSFYSWAPWADTGEPYSTNGWETVVIPLSLMDQTDYTGLDQEFGMAWQDADVLLNVAMDNLRFEEL